RDVEFAEGTFVAASATINPGTKIGKNVIVNTSSSIDHDCWIEDFVHIAPGAILCGTVTVGEGTHIGIGANIIQSIKIGKGAFISAGRIVKRDVADGTWEKELV
ncbi:MAG: serine acetyltransferase, partial [Candidatus Omnitrophota bacterium]